MQVSFSLEALLAIFETRPNHTQWIEGAVSARELDIPFRTSMSPAHDHSQESLGAYVSALMAKSHS